MSVQAWFRPPRVLIALFVSITLVPSALLLAFGWRLFEQDRAIGLQQLQDRREQAADLVVSALGQLLSTVEQSLNDSTALRALGAPGDAVTVVLTPNHVEAFPDGRLRYYPVVSPVPEKPEVFAAGEALEYREQDSAAAAAWFANLARSPEPSVRAGALIRQARNLRNAGQLDQAFAAYDNVIGISGAAVGGVPADLLARWATCDLLAHLNRRQELGRCASQLSDDLEGGRWRIDRKTYEVNIADARRWTGADTGVIEPGRASALSGAVDRLWTEWRQRPTTQERASGRESLTIDDVSVTVVWSGNRERMSALLAGPEYVEQQWLRKTSLMLERQHLRVALRDPATRVTQKDETRRAASDTGLPWTIAIADADAQGEMDRLSGRRTLWLSGLAILGILVVAGTAVIARAVNRDLTVARLQSDFVAAVSHEFRTPLTSLRQLTEILSDSRITSEERRQAYYAALSRQTERLHRLVESLLDFGRMEAGTSPYRLAAVDAHALIRSIVEQFRQEVSGRGYSVELEMQGMSTSIEADREALTTAVWNLLDNAVKYSPDCRTVWVVVERDDRQLFIRVRDRGLGIPREERHEIFRKFVRGERAKAERIKGTGIGLAMVQQIVAAHHGTVTVESEADKGSTFTITLPIACLQSEMNLKSEI